MKKNMLILALSLLSSQAFAVQEIPDTRISNDLAQTAIEHNEEVIRFNPGYCKVLGDQVCHFFLSHEYGHIALKHPLAGNFTAAEEYAADCWVAQNAPEELAKAAYTYFSDEGNMGSWSHGTGKQRAENLMHCPAAPASEKPTVGNSSTNLKQARSLYNHYWADVVFANVEWYYPSIFPRSGSYTLEFIYSDHVSYDKKYYNGSALSEDAGGLYYKVLGSQWYYWGSIANWRI